MRALVCEYKFGNARAIADRIAGGLRSGFDVTVVPVHGAIPDLVSCADLVVVGGPTHVRGTPSRFTRRAAVDLTARDSDLMLDATAAGPGLREWFRTVNGKLPGRR